VLVLVGHLELDRECFVFTFSSTINSNDTDCVIDNDCCDENNCPHYMSLGSHLRIKLLSIHVVVLGMLMVFGVV
jgi:hypothetical protein